ncbi:Resolvase domain protein [Mycoavidus cysteinexigens]|uniref:Resolvase domain protein n=1 Tax=Mycoavidus cysteinexigens TaxID=1553431 RepID=A0A2Z6EUR5_9BURK|nr:IS110 family transposase [Mycoavidus cysteinexigens]BBE08825.1 Resolvase domain protein [Mycoavidus cysteinexigens]GLR02341.1 IS110 family transposase [Mycoavidus cysteinexigens]
MKAYVGVDISKGTLDVQMGEVFFQVINQEQGWREFIKALKKFISAGNDLGAVVCEASGGYEKEWVMRLQKAGYPVHVAHANKVRAFARCKGYLAKTDKIDAKLIQTYAATMQVEADEPILSAEQIQLGDWLKRREQLGKDRQREINHLEHCTDALIKRSLKAHIHWLDKAIANIEQAIEQYKGTPDMRSTHALLTSVPGVGDLTAWHLIAFLPELGRSNHKSLAALVGVAPFNHDSGKHKGKRFIQGGRALARRTLYMSALACTRWNPDLKAFYQRLRAAGKPAKVALIAVLRKLISMLNSILQRQSPWMENLT